MKTSTARPTVLKHVPGLRRCTRETPWGVAGVYFLLKRASVVYVGQSTQVGMRVQAHAEKGHDSAWYVPVRDRAYLLTRLEWRYIKRFDPPCNSRYTSRDPRPVAGAIVSDELMDRRIARILRHVEIQYGPPCGGAR